MMPPKPPVTTKIKYKMISDSPGIITIKANNLFEEGWIPLREYVIVNNTMKVYTEITMILQKSETSNDH